MTLPPGMSQIATTEGSESDWPSTKHGSGQLDESAAGVGPQLGVDWPTRGRAGSCRSPRRKKISQPERSASRRVRNRLIQHGFLAGAVLYVFLWMKTILWAETIRHKRFKRGGW